MNKPLITQERLKELVSYDPETGVFTLKKHRRGTTRKIGDPIGSISAVGYLEAGIDQRIYNLHRLAFLYMTGSFPTLYVDHVNQIKTDNRWCNLREVTQQQNMENVRHIRSDSTTGYTGVHRYGSKYRAKINTKGKQVHLGTFNTAEEAAHAYHQAKSKYHQGYVTGVY